MGLGPGTIIRDSWPLLEIAIEPTSKPDAPRLAAALIALTAEDVALAVSIDDESGRIILGGTSKRHLALMIARLRETHGLLVVCGPPQVVYRETLTRRVEKDYTYRKQTAGAGQFVRVKLVCEPDATAPGTRFVHTEAGCTAPTAFIAGVATGIAAVARGGVLAGVPVVGVRVTLRDSAYHDADSSALAFKTAAAFREAMREGEAVLRQPIMRVTAITPLPAWSSTT